MASASVVSQFDPLLLAVSVAPGRRASLSSRIANVIPGLKQRAYIAAGPWSSGAVGVKRHCIESSHMLPPCDLAVPTSLERRFDLILEKPKVCPVSPATAA